MKRLNIKKIKLWLSLVLLYSGSVTYSQSPQILQDDDKPLECVTEADYQTYMKPAIKKNIADLRAAGKLSILNSAKMGGDVKLAWPLRMTDTYRYTDGVYQGWYIGNYADLNHAEGGMKDWWNCANWAPTGYGFTRAKTYDGHNGCDISPYPFPWQMMDDESVDIVAAADGEVIHMYTGNSIDRNCDTPHVFNWEEFNGGYYGNFIALLHEDGSITVYGHMKTGTVADVEVGDQVVQGQYLGKMGSSGNSSGPHLHFEYRLCEDCTYTEPWFKEDGCNDDITESKWISQMPFKNPKVLRVATHNNLPVFKDCSEYEGGSNETINTSNHFTTSEVLMISVAMQDFIVGDAITCDIISSSGIVKESQTFTVDAGTYYIREIIMFTATLTGYATGTYKIKITHDGNFYYHYFTVNCPPSLTLSGAQTGVKGYISGDFISSTATISGVSTNNILYQAENYVKLPVGFQATQNCQFHAEIDDCTIDGIKEAEDDAIVQENTMNVYPNPNMGMFSVYFNAGALSTMQVTVRNLMGEIIYVSDTENANEFSQVIDLQSQPKGIYFVELDHDGTVETKKVIIQ